MFNWYKPEVLDDDEDDGTMVDNVERLSQEVVGHKILSAQTEKVPSRYGTYDAFVIMLDNGKRVTLLDNGDCCAFTDLRSFLLNIDKVDHIITGVGTTEGFTKWHIFCDLGDVLELEVGWSCGNPFYYGYGFDIRVEDIDG